MIARNKELAELDRLYHSGRPELVAVYGRRRVGKTYLIDQAFKGKITFRHAGISPIDQERSGGLKRQLKHFSLSLQIQGMKKEKMPESWLEAFFLLEKFLQDVDDGSRQVVFLDELPWLDTPRSGFLSAFEAFWNSWGCHRDNLMVIVCGSANAWISDKLIHNHGGLYNRLTYEMKLSPFTLKECEDFLIERGISLSRYDIVQAYMILGGIPYYYGYFRPGYSLAQNIDYCFFSEQAVLADEYDKLFESVFQNPDYMKRIVAFLNSRRSGYLRNEILKGLKLSEGVVINDALKALCASDFIEKYIPFNAAKTEVRYRLVDPFCHFHLSFLQSEKVRPIAFWEENVNSPQLTSWRGLAFEQIAFSHIRCIKQALEISGISTTQSSWIYPGDDSHSGSQIDLLISRKDNVINMCEIKFSGNAYVTDKNYYQTILERIALLNEITPPEVAVHSTLITTFGLKRNEYSNVFSKVILLDDLFR